jgi:hypothetical protein
MKIFRKKLESTEKCLDIYPITMKFNQFSNIENVPLENSATEQKLQKLLSIIRNEVRVWPPGGFSPYPNDYYFDVRRQI